MFNNCAFVGHVNYVPIAKTLDTGILCVKFQSFITKDTNNSSCGIAAMRIFIPHSNNA